MFQIIQALQGKHRAHSMSKPLGWGGLFEQLTETFLSQALEREVR